MTLARVLNLSRLPIPMLPPPCSLTKSAPLKTSKLMTPDPIKEAMEAPLEAQAIMED